MACNRVLKPPNKNNTPKNWNPNSAQFLNFLTPLRSWIFYPPTILKLFTTSVLAGAKKRSSGAETYPI